MKVISFVNNKGGVLKTTLASNLSKFFSVDGNAKTLILDTDQQGNITIQFGFQPHKVSTTFATYSKNPKVKIKDCVFSVNPNLDVLACNFDITVVDEETKIEGLKRILDEANKKYDFVLIDTNPTINEFTISVLENSNLIVIPSFPELKAFNGMSLVLDNLNQLNLKKDTQIISIWTRFNPRSNLHKQMDETWNKEVSKKQKELKAKYIKYDGFISNSIKDESVVAFERIPCSFSKSKSKNKTEYETFYKFILKQLKK